MSYSIRYGTDTKQESQLKRQKNSRWVWLVALAGITAAVALWPQGKDLVQTLLFPWWNDSTAAAFEQMILQITGGTAVPAALMDFCREVIGNALAAV